MKKFFYTITVIAFTHLMLTPAFANNTDTNNIKLITEQYKEFLEKKNPALMSKYIAKDVEFYRNFDAPINYTQLYQHVIEQNNECVKLKILPFDQVVASHGKVAALYTLRCTDKNNVIHQKRIMSIAEINKDKKVSRFWQVAEQH